MKNKIILILLAGALCNLTCRVDAAAEFEVRPAFPVRAAAELPIDQLQQHIRNCNLEGVRAIVPSMIPADRSVMSDGDTPLEYALATVNMFKAMVERGQEVVKYLQSTLPETVLEKQLIDAIENYWQPTAASTVKNILDSGSITLPIFKKVNAAYNSKTQSLRRDKGAVWLMHEKKHSVIFNLLRKFAKKNNYSWIWEREDE